jgi:uncharacterized protein (TIGR03437 family)
MRKYFFIPVILLSGAALACGQTTDDFFNDQVVHEIRLDVRPQDFETLKRDFQFNTYYPADFHWKFNGRDITIPNIAIRSRGRGSRSPDKPNLRLDFNRYELNQKFIGLSSAVLKSNNQDGSMLREQSIMKLWDRVGLPASRETFCRLYVNNQYQGMYLLVEEIRSEYTERYLGEKGGDLYKFDPVAEGFRFEWRPTCATPAEVACSTDPAKWAEAPFNPEENKADYDITPTINLIRATNTVSDADFERTVSSMIDFRYLTSYVAMENFSADFDSFLGDVFGMNNFFVYRYKGTNLHQLLPWDKDSSYERSRRGIFEGTDENVLMRRILTIPAYKDRYLEAAYIVAVLAGGPGGWLEWEHQREYNLARPSIYEDTLKQYLVSGILYPSSNEIFEQEVAKNIEWLKERTPFVLSEILANGWQPSGAVTVREGAVINTATSAAGAAPGASVSIFGSGFSRETIEASSEPFPTTLGGVTVIVNGFMAPIQSVSPEQINIQMPWELGVESGSAPVTVIVDGPAMKGTRPGSPINGTISNTVSVSLSEFSPGVFQVTHADGSLTRARPAVADDTLVIYANGLGPVTEAIPTGGAAPLDRLVHTMEKPRITIGGIPAQVQLCGLAPGFVGAYQVNVKVPAGVRAGSAPLLITIGGQTSNAFEIATR